MTRDTPWCVDNCLIRAAITWVHVCVVLVDGHAHRVRSIICAACSEQPMWQGRDNAAGTHVYVNCVQMGLLREQYTPSGKPQDVYRLHKRASSCENHHPRKPLQRFASVRKLEQGCVGAQTPEKSRTISHAKSPTPSLASPGSGQCARIGLSPPRKSLQACTRSCARDRKSLLHVLHNLAGM